MSQSKYHKEQMVEIDGKEYPRRKCFRVPQVKEGTNGKVRIFSDKAYPINPDGSLNNRKPKLNKAEKKRLKRERTKGGK